MRVQLVEIAERPQRPSRLDPHALQQPGAGQGLDIGFLELDFRRLARVGAETEREVAAELVVDIARKRHFAVAERKAFRGALRFVARREPRNRRFVGREAGIPAVEDDADRGVERAVRRRFGGRRRGRGLGVGAVRTRLERRELRFERLEPRFVVPLEGLDLSRQGLRARRRRRLGAALAGQQQGRQHDRGKPGDPGALAHCTLLQAISVPADPPVRYGTGSARRNIITVQ